MDGQTTDTADTAAATRAKDGLYSAFEALAEALTVADDAADYLWGSIFRIRPLGVLSVPEMAVAIGKGRNYIDSGWSHAGNTVKGKRTRTPDGSAHDDRRDALLTELRDAALNHRVSREAVAEARAARDVLVARVYKSKILGPTAIGRAVGIDRNHVLRIAHSQGVPPVHRLPGSVRNQYTEKA